MKLTYDSNINLTVNNTAANNGFSDREEFYIAFKNMEVLHVLEAGNKHLIIFLVQIPK